MKNILKSIICFSISAIFLACAGHCLVEEAFGVSEHSAAHCEDHASSQDSDQHEHSQQDHHHHSPCASTISLVTKGHFLSDFLFFHPDLALVIPQLPQINEAQDYQPNTQHQQIYRPYLFLSDLSLAPNAPPALC